MDDSTLFRLIGVSLFLVLLLILAYYVARKGKTGGLQSSKRNTQKIHILETRAIDLKRQISLVSIDRKEYIILAGVTGESIILHKTQEEQAAQPSLTGQHNAPLSPTLNTPPPLNAHFGIEQ